MSQIDDLIQRLCPNGVEYRALGDVLIERIRTRFPLHLEGTAYRPPIPIVAATLGDEAGVIGAAVLARELLH